MSAVRKPEWTDEQRRAIATRDASVALSAGAGCGKTFVLSERFLTELDPRASDDVPAELDELIAFTYTERAAREMRDRVRKKCVERLNAASDEDAPRWLDLLRALDTARISTVHSFCLSLLRSHAVEVGVDPQFVVLDPAQAEALRMELIDDALRARLEQLDAAAMRLVTTFGIGGVRDRLSAILGSRDLRQPGPGSQWTVESLMAAWQEHLPAARRGIQENLASSAKVRQVASIVNAGTCPDPANQPNWETLQTHVSRLAVTDTPHADLLALASALRLQGLTTKKAWNDDAAYEKYSELAKSLRPTLERNAAWFTDDPPAWQTAAELGVLLLELANDVSQRFRTRKRELGGLDFDDLIAEAHRLLTDEEHIVIRRNLAARTRLLLVDEAQDSNRVQVELIAALCDAQPQPGRRFVVGDYKQSIYRFLGAEPEEFRRLRADVPEAGRLPLTRNFRSQPAILDFVNALFRGAFAPDYEPLRAQRPQTAPEPAVEFLWAEIDDAQGRVNAEARRRAEAEAIAGRLTELLADPTPRVGDEEARRRGEERLRRVEPRDIAVLFRALSDVAIYEAALQRHGIPYYLVGGKAFYAQQEIYDVSNLLRCLDSLCDNVSLVGALRSPFFALADETLFWLAQAPGGLAATLFSGKLPPQVTGEQAAAVAFAADTLNELRRHKDRLSIAGLIQRALDLTGYDAALLGEFLGERKLANLRKLVDKARAFDRTGRMTLADFVVQLTEFEARQPDESLAATEAETADVVRLMTVHQSKGLEFPVVVVADLGRQSGNQSKPAVYDRAWGPLVYVPNPSVSGEQRGKLPIEFYREAITVEDERESTRLFYVATTRAADYLLLSASSLDARSAASPWLNLLAERFDLSTGELQAAAVSDAPAPRVQVTTTPSASPTTRSSLPNKLALYDVLAALDNAQGEAVGLPAGIAPIARDPRAARFYSFSRLRGTLHARPAAPQQAEDSEPILEIDPIGLGTLVHAVLEEVNYCGENDVAALVARRARQHGEADGPEVDVGIELLQRFLRSSRAAEVARAASVRREVEFLLSWSPAEADRGNHGGIYVQGFLDCLYQDADGQWHIVDFKTNHVSAAEAPAVAETYELQMLLYALAAEQALGRPPVELALHFLRPGIEHSFAWNVEARRRLDLLMREGLASAGANQTDPSVH